MTDFLLELRSEEIPARMQAKGREDLAKLFASELGKAEIVVGNVTTYATPRRLALIARGLPDQTQAVSEETKGPKTSAPPQALQGFLRKAGLTREQLVERDGVLFAVTEKPGRATADVLAEAIPAIVRAFPWPKSMRWGDASLSTESLRWVRPLHGIVALFGEDVVPCQIAGIESGAATLGHRFHHPGQITIGSAGDYVEKLRMVHVLVDQDERAQIVRDGARRAAMQAGLELVEDEGLVAENAGLTEWPVPLLGRFDPAFLDVPPEVIQLTARVNQKYFVCRSADGKLANAFVCTANIAATDGGAKIVEGNRKVLAARLADARFFYETDLKVPLAEQAKKLDRIVFHEKLGTVADKVDRVAKLARWLVEEGIVPLPAGEGGSRDSGGRVRVSEVAHSPSPLGADAPHPSPDGRGVYAALADRAARLAKADLVTGMVGEFPELQGLMGGYYAAVQGEDPRVAAAVRDHYKPVGQGDDVPTDPVTVAVSLADKLDTVVSMFIGVAAPTGSKDPFALRRAAIGVISTIVDNDLRLSLKRALQQTADTFVTTALTAMITRDSSVLKQIESSQRLYPDRDLSQALESRNRQIGALARALGLNTTKLNEATRAIGETASKIGLNNLIEVTDFFADRLKVQQRDAGVRHDLIDAVFALGGEDDFVRLLARVRALQGFVGTADGANLLAGYKRAANILKKEGVAPSSPLPVGEGQGAQAPRGEGGGDTSDRPHPSDASRLPPSPEGRGKALSYTPEIAEAALVAALDAAEPAAATAVAHEDFEGAMMALASLRAPIDAFFETVIVNDPDPAKRDHRLALLARVRAAVHNVADFSRIEG
ncbi:glycine--tRNA ligase subunit beta [uncultured Sphingomonas sp.]|uniref:glycine--tRNA ligase subunit beta n=1 Tax=uncultured Sphingomonas sp. TaxID=158754 RepID=UPI0035CADE18